MQSPSSQPQDILARLRTLAGDETSWLYKWPIIIEAADEIERLRVALDEAQLADIKVTQSRHRHG